MMKTPRLTYYDLGAGVTAFSTTRHGGHSHGDYGEMNVNAYCGDDADDVDANRQLLCTTLGLRSTEQLIIPHQTHETTVRRIDTRLLAQPENLRQEALEGVDAVMTDVPEVCIGVSTADCIPIIIYDTRLHVACAVHAGWRGTVARIARKAVRSMAETYGSRPQDLRAVIGPGISLRHFEVGQEVWQQFADAGFDMSVISRKYQKWHIDLWTCNRLQLVETGMAPDSIQTVGICTFEHTGDFFSARRLGVRSGRIFTGIILRKSPASA